MTYTDGKTVAPSMTSHKSELSFKNPPLKEVSFSIQFEPIEEFHLGQIGLAWDVFKSRYPKVETADELPHEIEKFGVITRKRPGLQFFERAPIPRVMFISEDMQYLIQIQKDRFVFNWRKQFDDTLAYPRYPKLRERFLAEYEIFSHFLSSNGLKSPVVDQVEFSYVNHIDADNRSIDDVFQHVLDESRFAPSLELETFSINLKHLMQVEGRNLGRMYTSIEKANRITDGKEIYVLNFTTRMHPTEPTLKGVQEAMDIMRGQINESFSNITTQRMHEEWNGSLIES